MKSPLSHSKTLRSVSLMAGSALLGGALVTFAVGPVTAQTAVSSPLRTGILAPPPAPGEGAPLPPAPGEAGPGPMPGPGGAPRHGGPGLPGGPVGPEGPAGHGPGGPGDARERAYRGAAEFSRYRDLKGDAPRLMEQAHDYYVRSGNAMKQDKKAQSEQLARVSEQLVQAALHLARAEKGPLPAPQVAGWEVPTRMPDPKPPKADQDSNPRVLIDLGQRLKEAPTTANVAPWVASAHRLHDAAKQNIATQRFEAGRERAHAAMSLLDAAKTEMIVPSAE